MPTPPPASPARHGVLIVHGIGNQRQSDILLDVGEPLVDWLQHWYAARSAQAWQDLPQRVAQRPWWQRPPVPWWQRWPVPLPDDAPRDALPTFERVALNFDPVDRGAANDNAFASLALPDGDRWVLAEAWWAASLRRQPFGEMLRWSLRHLWEAGRALVFGAWERLTGAGRDPAALPWLPRVALSAYYLVMFACFFLGLIVGFVPLVFVLLLAQLPLPMLRNALYGVVGPFLEVNLGEFRTMFEDSLQSANVRRRLAQAVCELTERHGCTDVTIVAHSGGAVASFDLLADPRHAGIARRVRKLITVGSGLNRAWAIAPTLARLHGPLPGHLHWVDLWATFDPAPSGPIQPPRDPLDKAGNVAVFAPDDRVVATQRLEPREAASLAAQGRTRRQAAQTYWPASVRCTNELSVITDHWVYWRNDEEALARIIAEIDAPYYRESRFWRGDYPLTIDGESVDQEPYPLADADGQQPPVAPRHRERPYLDSRAEQPLRDGIRQRRSRVVTLAAARLVALGAWLLLAIAYAERLGDWLYASRASALPLPQGIVGVLTWGDGRLADRLAAFERIATRTVTLLDRPFGQPALAVQFRLLNDLPVIVTLAVLAIAGFLAVLLHVRFNGLLQRQGAVPSARWQAYAPWGAGIAAQIMLLPSPVALLLHLLAGHPVYSTIALLPLGLPALLGFTLYRWTWERRDARARAICIAAIATNRHEK